jgi:hypothetical protein
MGLVPVFLMIASFFFVWAGVMYHTFKSYRQQALQAANERSSSAGNAYEGLAMADFLSLGRAGSQKEPSWQVEYTYRNAVFRYHSLLSKAPYRIFARWFGFKKIR